MFLRSLAVSFLICSCAAKKPVTIISESINRPYLTLYDGCELDEGTQRVGCNPEAFRKALKESADLVKQNLKLKKEIDAKEAHSVVDSWFFQSRLDEEKRKRERAESDRYWWGAGGVGVGIVTMLLTFLFAN